MTTIDSPESAPIRVGICDDHALFRTGLRMILAGEPGFAFGGEAASGEEAIVLARDARIDVLLMDVRMPGIGGIAATERIIAELGERSPRILVLTTINLDTAVTDAVRAGASGFILKAAEPELLAAAIRTVHHGQQLFAASAALELIQRQVAARVVPAPPPAFELLSEREREIFLLAAHGLSNAEIAQREFLSVGTVKTHISAVLGKLGVRDRIQLVVYAYEHGLVQPGA